jgi:NitT/TauT family transport system substrate-binding protein
MLMLFPSLWALPTFAQMQAVKPIDIRMAVPGPGSTVSLPLELAVKLGLDRIEGVNLRLKFVAGGGIAISDIQAADVEYGVFGLPAAMAARLTDDRLVALAVVEDRALWALMVRSDLHNLVRKVADLRGKRIGVHSNSISHKTVGDSITNLVLSSHGIAPGEARLVSAGQNWESQTAALQSGNVDAVMTDEPMASRMLSEKIAYPIFNTANLQDARETPGAGFLRATLIGREDRIKADPVGAERTVKVIKNVLDWMATHTPDQIADQIGLKGKERAVFITFSKKYPHQYSREAKFSANQLTETEVFFRASEAENLLAKSFSVNTMVMDRWAGRKP